MNSEIKNRIFGNELKYVKEVLETEFRSSKGAGMMQRLETAFASKFESKFGIAHVNGTATMHAVLEAWGIGPGDEVIVPPLTMSSTCFAVLQANATPVFADIHPDNWCIDAKAIESKVTPKTKAIITVSIYGLSPDMDPILEVANRHGLMVLEDNAQSFLSRYKGRMVGTIGHAASFSFQSSKHLASGEGGIVITDSADLADRVRKINSLGYAGVGAAKGKITKTDIQDPDYSRHVSMGWNYRMPELCAAVALGQLENLDHLVGRRQQVAKMFSETVGKCDWLVPQRAAYDATNSYWTFVVRMAHPKITWHQFRDKFLSLGGDGVYAAWKLNYLEPAFQNTNFLGREKFISENNLKSYKPGLCPVAEQIAPRLLQFKTNYWDLARAEKQMDVMRTTLRFFE